MRNLTKSEQKILDHVRYCNAVGALAGLAVSPSDPKFTTKEFRFVRRLFLAGLIKWCDYTSVLGAGWALSAWNPPAP